MTTRPLFTIVTVTFNAESCIERTMRSVLEQDYPDVEYIVVDGGSKDGTISVVQRYEKHITRWISEPDKGIYDGMNKGIALATGEYLLFMNADDVFADAHVLSRVAALLGDSREADVVYGNWITATEHGEYPGMPQPLESLPRKWVLCHQATFVKTDLLKSHPFDFSLRYVGDFAQISGLYLEHYKFLYVEVPIALLPINSGTTFNNFEASTREHFAVLRQRELCRPYEMHWMLFRKRVVRWLKTSLPSAWSDALFKFLAKHYKVM